VDGAWLGEIIPVYSDGVSEGGARAERGVQRALRRERRRKGAAGLLGAATEVRSGTLARDMTMERTD